MKSKWRVMITIIMVISLVIIGSMGSLAFAQDKVQTRDRDCIEDPNHKYCDKELIDCDQEQDRLRQCLLDCDGNQDGIRKCLKCWENDWNQMRIRSRLTRILLLNI
ncbi:MAG: hypothetical protein K0Q47_296 [Sedimentibacter sp.]|jgi:hypothetical protein|nr:hypothetical protein [Sedimentibacter sp.]